MAASEATVIGVFRSTEEARAAVSELRHAGIPRENISVVANAGASGSDALAADATADVAADAGIGAALGSIGGLLLGFTTLVIPGVGPVMAAGPLLAALGGAGIGAVAGGLMGALSEAGVPEADASGYAEQVRGGNVLVTVRAADAQADRVRAILDSAAAGGIEVPQPVADKMAPVEGPGSPSECDLRTADVTRSDPKTAKTADVVGHNAGGEAMSADEARRDYQQYARQNAGRATWPHKQAFDICDSVTRPEVLQAEQDPTGYAERAGADTRKRARVYRRP